MIFFLQFSSTNLYPQTRPREWKKQMDKKWTFYLARSWYSNKLIIAKAVLPLLQTALKPRDSTGVFCLRTKTSPASSGRSQRGWSASRKPSQYLLVFRSGKFILKGQWHDFKFFYESVSPKPLSILLGPFRIFSKICRDISSLRCKFAAGIIDTSAKFATAINNTSSTSAAPSLANISTNFLKSLKWP